MIAEFDKENTGTISFEGFLDMLASHTADIDVEREMVAAFCEFDTACVGRLDRETFYKILSGGDEDQGGSWLESLSQGSHNAKISRQEIDRVLDKFQCVDPVTQTIDYPRFVHRLMLLE